MAKREILSIGMENYFDGEVEFRSLKSEASLCDGDIIFFEPVSFDVYTFYGNDIVCHWEEQINAALDGGKTVIVFLTEDPSTDIESVMFRKEEDLYLVTVYGYSPIKLNVRNEEGRVMNLHPKNRESMLPYWGKMKKYSEFRVVMNNPELSPCLTTKNGEKIVGAIFNKEGTTGNLVFLPYLDFGEIKANDKSGEFISAITSLDKMLRKNHEGTSEPKWLEGQDEYKTSKEVSIEKGLSDIDNQIEALENQRSNAEKELGEFKLIKKLLYENSIPLEKAVIKALSILGFETSSYTSSELDIEIDVVFSSEKEGVFVGETKGSDNDQIKDEKINQLVTNALGYSKKEGAGDVLPKRVLFGNAYKEHPLAERGDPFSRKCVNCAKEFLIALVSTPDLFEVVKYLSDNNDKDYAQKCRQAILDASGRVKFPPPPKS